MDVEVRSVERVKMKTKRRRREGRRSSATSLKGRRNKLSSLTAPKTREIPSNGCGSVPLLPGADMAI